MVQVLVFLLHLAPIGMIKKVPLFRNSYIVNLILSLDLYIGVSMLGLSLVMRCFVPLVDW